MRVQIVDPSAFTPPYDHALSGALARAGADVELVTSRFLYGPVPREDGYRVSESFYRRTADRGLDAPARRAFKLAEHVPDLLRFRRAEHPEIVHWQWLTASRSRAAPSSVCETTASKRDSSTRCAVSPALESGSG